jgi:hypothetical protein
LVTDMVVRETGFSTSLRKSGQAAGKGVRLPTLAEGDPLMA